jgi:hypothetical protein
VFLKGFKEAIGIAVALVGAYLVLNAVVVGHGLYRVAMHPQVFGAWRIRLFQAHGNPLAMLGVSLLLFPKLALGLSGFETGVALMPLVKGDPEDTPPRPEGRIRNTRKLLVVAALIMSVLLITSSLVTTLLIPAEEFRPATGEHPAGKANGRALAYLWSSRWSPGCGGRWSCPSSGSSRTRRRGGSSTMWAGERCTSSRTGPTSATPPSTTRRSGRRARTS